MLHLLKLEWLKMQNYRPFKVIGILYLAILPMFFFVGKNLDLPREIPVDTIYMFPYVWLHVGYFGNWLCCIFFGFLSIMFITGEFSYKTVRQNIMTGLNRNEFVAGKVLFMLSVSVLATLYYAIIAGVFGFLNTDYVVMQRVTEQLYYVPRYCLMCFGYMCFAFMLALWIRRTGLTVLLYLSYIFILEPLIRGLVHGRGGDSKLSAYYPLNAIEDLVHLFADPRVQSGSESMNARNFFEVLPGWEAVAFSSLYIGLFIGISFWLMRRRDL